MRKKVSRRDFVKQTVAGAAVLAGVPAGELHAAVAAPAAIDGKVIAALGALFIPSRQGDAGYEDLEVYGITDHLLKVFSAVDGLPAFNSSASEFFDGKTFLDLDEKQRGDYLNLIIEGTKITDADRRNGLQAFYRSARTQIMGLYYKNFPEHEVKRSAAGDPILKPGDTHQRNWEYDQPNTKKVKTGWDIAGYQGPLTWDEEESYRAKAKKTWDHWDDDYLVKLAPGRPPAAAAIKTSEGHDYYDVIVIGGGTAGCIVAGRLAERGINPKTGDRLKVAMIEGGDDWTIRDQGIRPGYGGPIRRSKVTNIPDGIGPEGDIPGPEYRYDIRSVGSGPLQREPGDENFRLVGGCSNHYGGTCWIPGDEDFHFYRESSGVDWELSKFGDAIQEVREFFHPTAPPDAWWTKADRMWADAGAALGFELRSTETALRNGLGVYEGEYLSRVDAKGTSLPWAYIGLNNGLKVIANAVVEQVVIEKVPGGRPVARGAIYRDKTGTMREVRAARVIVALGTNFTPLLMYKSGYGPRDILGDKLIVENKNVGAHLTGDSDLRSSVYLSEAIYPEGRAGQMHGGGPWVAMNPRPWGELSVHIRDENGVGTPNGAALGTFAPQFGWEHKEYMRNMNGPRRVIGWATHFGAIPWSWRVLPTGKISLVEVDEPRFAGKIKEASEVIRAWSEKLSVKPVKSDFRAFSRPVRSIAPQHRVGTARAGANAETSVCTSDFDCHDIDNLLFTSAAAIPRTFFWSCGPVAVNACYSWRRMVANHFSTGSSTKGFA